MFFQEPEPAPHPRHAVFLLTQRAICLFPESPWPGFLAEHLKVAEAAYIDTVLTVLEPNFNSVIEREETRDEAYQSYIRLLFAFCRHHAINLYDTSPAHSEAFRTAMEELCNLLYQLTEKDRMLAATYGAAVAVNPLWGAPLQDLKGEIEDFYTDLLDPDFFEESADALFTFAKARFEKRPAEELRALYRRARAGNFREQETIELLEGVSDPEERCAIERALSQNLLIRDLITILTPEERAKRTFNAPAVLECIKAVHRALRDPQSRDRNLDLARAHGLNIPTIPHHINDWIEILRDDPVHRPEAPFLRALWEGEASPESIESRTQTRKAPTAMQRAQQDAAEAESYLPQAIEFLQDRDTIALSTLQRNITHSYTLTQALINRLIQDDHLTPNPAGGYTVLHH